MPPPVATGPLQLRSWLLRTDDVVTLLLSVVNGTSSWLVSGSVMDDVGPLRAPAMPAVHLDPGADSTTSRTGWRPYVPPGQPVGVGQLRIV